MNAADMRTDQPVLIRSAGTRLCPPIAAGVIQKVAHGMAWVKVTHHIRDGKVSPVDGEVILYNPAQLVAKGEN